MAKYQWKNEDIVCDDKVVDPVQELNRLHAQLVATNTALAAARDRANNCQYELAVASNQAVNYKEQLTKLNRIISGLK